MKMYTIFDDFNQNAIDILQNAGIVLDIHPKGETRPDKDRIKEIIEEYDGVIIGTSQKLAENMFQMIDCPKIIATASIGTDHICIPKNKKELIKIINAPHANAYAVAEYTFSAALMCCRRMEEGKRQYLLGKDNKTLSKKPSEIFGKTIGVVGAGNISKRIMEFAKFFGMNILCWTKHFEKHNDLLEYNVKFVSLQELVENSDIISVNLPNIPETKGIISEELVSCMKTDAIFISVSRLDTVDMMALIEKSKQHKSFYSCVDIDLNKDIAEWIKGIDNVIITPHIAGGSIEARDRMFIEVANNIVNAI